MRKKVSKKRLKKGVDDLLAHFEQTIGLPNIAELKNGFPTPPGEEPSVSHHAGKKRGAPAGNQNARKHGLYSRIAPAQRRGDMDKALDMEPLTQEAAMLRLLLVKLMENPDENLKEILQILRVLTPIVRLNLMVEDDDDSLL